MCSEPEACTKCGTPVHRTEDWTLWPWPDGARLCSPCNDERHEVDDFIELERRHLKPTAAVLRLWRYFSRN